MSILPRIREGCVCIPWWEVPIIWSWRAVTYAIMICGVDIAVISMIGMASLSFETLLSVAAVAIFVSACYFVFVGLDRFNGQKKQASEMKLKAAEEKRDLSAIEKIECEKVEKFDITFVFSALFGIGLSALIAVLADLIIGGYFNVPADATAMFCLGALVAAFCSAIIIDQKIVGPVASAKFRDSVSKLYDEAEEDFRKSASGSDEGVTSQVIAAILAQNEKLINTLKK